MVRVYAIAFVSTEINIVLFIILIDGLEPVGAHQRIRGGEILT